MTISAITTTEIYNPLSTVEPTETPEEQIAPPAEEEAAEPAPATVTDEAAVESESDTGGKGVLRLLQAGHFKGVADVRLRINFHDEIAAMEAEKAAQVAADGVANISGTVTSEIDAYIDSVADETTAAAIGEARDAFTSELSAITADGDGGDVIGQIQTAFDNFVASIAPASEDVPEESIEETPAETDTIDDAVTISTKAVVDEPAAEPEAVDDSAVSLDEFVAQLTELFAAELADLETSLADISVLPPLSEPSGNGKAYDKFVAIYNEMQGGDIAATIDTVS